MPQCGFCDDTCSKQRLDSYRKFHYNAWVLGWIKASENFCGSILGRLVEVLEHLWCSLKDERKEFSQNQTLETLLEWNG